jgi:hypothetical protein
MRLNPRVRASERAEGAQASDDVSDSFEEFVRGRSAHLFQLPLLLTDRNQADAQDLGAGRSRARLGQAASHLPIVASRRTPLPAS